MQPSDIISVLPEKFKNASEQIFFPSVVYEHQDIGLKVGSIQRTLPQILTFCQFELRLCTALQKKPVDRDAAGHLSLSSEPDTATKKNPFAPPYAPHLYLGELTLQDGDEISDYVVLVGTRVGHRHRPES